MRRVAKRKVEDGSPIYVFFMIALFISCFSNIIFKFQRSILERLCAGEVIVGDGGMTYALERRGYVKAGPWTPECTVEHPEAGEWKYHIHHH